MYLENLTIRSKDLFKALVEDANNWNGTPLLDITKEERGNLTQLKQEGLLETFKDEDKTQWVIFSDKGREAAIKEFGITIIE